MSGLIHPPIRPTVTISGVHLRRDRQRRAPAGREGGAAAAPGWASPGATSRSSLDSAGVTDDTVQRPGECSCPQVDMGVTGAGSSGIGEPSNTTDHLPLVDAVQHVQTIGTAVWRQRIVSVSPFVAVNVSVRTSVFTPVSGSTEVITTVPPTQRHDRDQPLRRSPEPLVPHHLHGVPSLSPRAVVGATSVGVGRAVAQHIGRSPDSCLVPLHERTRSGRLPSPGYPTHRSLIVGSDRGHSRRRGNRQGASSALGRITSPPSVVTPQPCQ